MLRLVAEDISPFLIIQLNIRNIDLGFKEAGNKGELNLRGDLQLKFVSEFRGNARDLLVFDEGKQTVFQNIPSLPGNIAQEEDKDSNSPNQQQDPAGRE